LRRGGQAALNQDRDFWFDSTNSILYVYSAGGNPATHYSTVAPIVLSGQSVLNISDASWLEIQHLQIDWYDTYGVQIQRASDHLWLANIMADSEVENGAVPLGFYVHPSGTPVDIHLYNTDANMNYSGYRFHGSGCLNGGCAFEIKNCRAYGNRAYGIMDNVQGAVSYDFCQPGRMKIAEDRLVVLKKNDLRRNVYDRIVIAAITFAITFGMSALLASRFWLGLK
jgi:hypothetical protein